MGFQVDEAWHAARSKDGRLKVDGDDIEEKALVVYETGMIMYICKAAIGTALDDALWQIKKVDMTTGVIITWADSDSKYDNLATDLATVEAPTYG